MKTLSRIFGILILLIALGACVMTIWRADKDKDEAAQAQTQITAAQTQLNTLKEAVKTLNGESKTEMDAQIAEAEKKIDAIPTPSTYLIVEIFLSALLALSLVFAFFLFRPNLNLIVKLMGAAVLLTLAAYLITPDIERGPYGGANGRTLALISGIPVILVGLCALLVAKKSFSKRIEAVAN